MKQEEWVGGTNGSIKCFQSSWLRRDGEKSIYKNVCVINDAGSHCKSMEMCNDRIKAINDAIFKKKIVYSNNKGCEKYQKQMLWIPKGIR